MSDLLFEKTKRDGKAIWYIRPAFLTDIKSNLFGTNTYEIVDFEIIGIRSGFLRKVPREIFISELSGADVKDATLKQTIFGLGANDILFKSGRENTLLWENVRHAEQIKDFIFKLKKPEFVEELKAEIAAQQEKEVADRAREAAYAKQCASSAQSTREQDDWLTPPTIYSAARAKFTTRKASPEKMWRNLTNMFHSDRQKRVGTRSYVLNNHQMEDIVRKKSAPDAIAGVGDIFNYRASRGTVWNVEITDWTPHKSFAFEESIEPKQPSGQHIKARCLKAGRKTEFFIAAEKGRTIVEVRHRLKGITDFSRSFLMALACKGGNAGIAASNLKAILSGNNWTADEGDTKGNVSVVRDDDYRLNF